MVEPAHRRSLVFEAFDTEEGVQVVGRLRDERPWARDPRHLPVIHDLELEVTVRATDLVLTSAVARMNTFPHAECPAIQAAFGDMVGMCITRGYSRALQERFRGVSGCTHLLELGRALGPAVMQSTFSSLARRSSLEGATAFDSVDDDGQVRLLRFLTDTCHVWASDGVGFAKIERGWRPGTTIYPVPPLSTWPARGGNG